jgi:AAHS family benzoate transporter-like MFS transporter
VPSSREALQIGRKIRAKYAVLAIMLYQGLTMPLLGVVSPWLAPRFGLSTAGVAKLYAAMSLSALLTFFIARMVDRSGRRAVLIACLLGSSGAALGGAFAGSIVPFAICELVRFSMLGALGSSAIALLAEAAPSAESRAAAVAQAGMAAASGGALLLVVVPLLSAGAHAHRSAYLLAASGVVLVPALFAWVRESACWQREQAAGSVRATSIFSVFGREYLRHSAPILGSSLLSGVEGAAVGGWSYYYGVSVLGVSPSAMSSWSVAATVTGFVGFRAGAVCAERYGRVRTVVAFGLVHQAAALWLYLGPATAVADPALCLGLGLCLSGFGASASGTAKSTLGVELFPAQLRGTVMGWNTLCAAVATGSANLLVGALVAPLGGLSFAIALLSLCGVVGLVIFGTYVVETRPERREPLAAGVLTQLAVLPGAADALPDG